MREELEDLFDSVGAKTVTKTDKDKGAFVLNEAQRNVLENAGIYPGDGGENATRFEVDVPNDPDGLRLSVSYYNSVRQGAGRTPETRMGRDIVHWMNIGDELVLANIGSAIFAWKENAPSLSLGELAGSVAHEANRDDLLKKGRAAAGKPPRKDRTVSDYYRNSAVVAGALARAHGFCEMPNCTRDTFNRTDGTIFLEVHHVTPLAEGGDDSMKNAAALCPTCHRELHFGSLRMTLREKLRAEVLRKETKG